MERKVTENTLHAFLAAVKAKYGNHNRHSVRKYMATEYRGK